MNVFRTYLTIVFLIIIVFIAGCDTQEKETPAKPVSVAPQYAGTIIAVGNSLTAGLGVAEIDAWPALLEKKLQQEGYNWQVINAGISGETSSGALRRIPWILSHKPDIVIFETGANDGLRGIPIPIIQENINKAVQMLQEGNVTVILAGMQMVRNLGPDYTRDFAAIYSAVAKNKNCLLIPFLLQDVAAVPSLNQEDAIHPNEQGHTIIAQTVYPFVLEALEKDRQ